MPAGLTVEEQLAWTVDYVRELEQRHNDLSAKLGRRASAQADAVPGVRNEAERLMREAVDQVCSEFRQLVGCDIGWEVVALGLVLVGGVLAVLKTPEVARHSRNGHVRRARASKTKLADTPVNRRVAG